MTCTTHMYEPCACEQFEPTFTLSEIERARNIFTAPLKVTLAWGSMTMRQRLRVMWLIFWGYGCTLSGAVIRQVEREILP